MNKKIIISEKQIKLLTEDTSRDGSINPEIVRAYSFDWDDNIVSMPTTIKVVKNGEKIEVPTDEYANIRNSPEYSYEYSGLFLIFAYSSVGTSIFSPFLTTFIVVGILTILSSQSKE